VWGRFWEKVSESWRVWCLLLCVCVCVFWGGFMQREMAGGWVGDGFAHKLGRGRERENGISALQRR
jgi:hypothetical protein